jgi:hypothetical protein
MTTRFLLDENLRGKPLWMAIHRHNALGVDPLDVERVGDVADLPLGSSDGRILKWAEREARILLSEDKRTLPVHLATHLRSGRSSPGIFLIHPSARIPDIIDFLLMVAGDPSIHSWRDSCMRIP